jgi:hypothetical protein
MPVFLIGTGQGILAGGWEGRTAEGVTVMPVRPDGCREGILIVGYREPELRGVGEFFAGAFHYPPNGVRDEDVRKDMQSWMKKLQPSDLTVLLPDPGRVERMYPGWELGGGEMGCKNDQSYLRSLADKIKAEAFPVVRLEQRGATVLLPTDPRSQEGTVTLTTRDPGKYRDYGEYTLVGRTCNDYIMPG